MSRKKKWRRTGFGIMLDQYRVLQSVADEYDLHMLQAEGKHRVFRVGTTQGWKKFKRFRYSIPELEFVHDALEHLVNKGWKRCEPLHSTKEGNSYIETPQGLFYATVWVQGLELNPQDPFQLQAGANILGEMHRLCEDFSCQRDCHRCYPEDWLQKYRRRGEDLLRYQQQAEAGRKEKFSRRFRQAADDFLRALGNGLQLLEDGGYGPLRENPSLLTVCHTSPIASNLIAGQDGRVHLIDFDNARQDLRIYDLARMIVRHSDWDVDKALFLLRCYQEANPLLREEIALIPALCALSTPGWQVARSFYERGKQHLSRLEDAIDSVAKQDQFVKTLLKLQPADLVHTPAQVFQTIPHPELPESPLPATVMPSGSPELPGVKTDESESTCAEAVGEGFYWGDGESEMLPEHPMQSELIRISRQLSQVAVQVEQIVDVVQGRGRSVPADDLAHPLLTDPVTAAGGQEWVPGVDVVVHEAPKYNGRNDRQESEVGLSMAAKTKDPDHEIVTETAASWEGQPGHCSQVEGEYVPALAAHGASGDEVKGEYGAAVVAQDGSSYDIAAYHGPALAAAQDDDIAPGVEIPVHYSLGLDLTAEGEAAETVAMRDVTAAESGDFVDGPDPVVEESKSADSGIGTDVGSPGEPKTESTLGEPTDSSLQVSATDVKVKSVSATVSPDSADGKRPLPESQELPEDRFGGAGDGEAAPRGAGIAAGLPPETPQLSAPEQKGQFEPEEGSGFPPITETAVKWREFPAPLTSGRGRRPHSV